MQPLSESTELHQLQQPLYDQSLVLPPLDESTQLQPQQPSETAWQPLQQPFPALQPYPATALDGDPNYSDFMPQFSQSSYPLPVPDANFVSPIIRSDDSMASHTSTASTGGYTPNFTAFPDFSSDVNYTQPLQPPTAFADFQPTELCLPSAIVPTTSSIDPTMTPHGMGLPSSSSPFLSPKSALQHQMDETKRKIEELLAQGPLIVDEGVDPYEAPLPAYEAPPPAYEALPTAPPPDEMWPYNLSSSDLHGPSSDEVEIRYSCPPSGTIVSFRVPAPELKPQLTDLWSLTGDLEMPPEDPKNNVMTQSLFSMGDGPRLTELMTVKREAVEGEQQDLAWQGFSRGSSANAANDESENTNIDYNIEASGSSDPMAHLFSSPWIPQNSTLLNTPSFGSSNKVLHEMMPPPKLQPQPSGVNELLNSAVSSFQGGQREIIMGLIDTISQLNGKQDKEKKKLSLSGTAHFDVSSLANRKQPAIFQFPGKGKKEVMVDLARWMGEYSDGKKSATRSVCHFLKWIMDKVYTDPSASLQVTAGCEKSTKGFRIVPPSSIQTLAKFWKAHFVASDSHSIKDISELITLHLKNYLDKNRSEVGRKAEKEKKEEEIVLE